MTTDPALHAKIDNLTSMVTDVRIATAEHGVQLGQLDRDRADAAVKRAETDRRLTALERWRWTVAGIAAAAAFIAHELLPVWGHR